MAGINTLILNQGVGKAIQAQADEGFFIKITSFGISETAGSFDEGRTSANTEWAKEIITFYNKIDDNTVELVCEVPPNITDRTTNLPVSSPKNIGEVYVYGLDENLDEFLFAIGQPEFVETYDPSGAYEFRIQLKILNVTVDNIYTFSYTQAKEITLHNENPNAHQGLFGFYEIKTADFTPVKGGTYLIKPDIGTPLINVNLPPVEDDLWFVLKDATGNLGVNDIKVVRDDLADKIDGATIDYDFKSNFESIQLVAKNGEWYITKSHSGKEPTSFVSYLGDKNSDGSWRFRLDGTSLKIETRIAGVWTLKDEYTP